MAVGWELDERRITTPAAIGVVLGMPASGRSNQTAARRPMARSEVVLLEAAAARLEVEVLPRTEIEALLRPRYKAWRLYAAGQLRVCKRHWVRYRPETWIMGRDAGAGDVRAAVRVQAALTKND